MYFISKAFKTICSVEQETQIHETRGNISKLSLGLDLYDLTFPELLITASEKTID